MSALAAIHTGLKQLGIEQEDARDLYSRLTGKRSLRAMTAAEQQRVIEELRRRGFRKGASKGARKPLEGKFAKKLQALWIAAWNLGLVRDRDDKALVAFVRRQTGIDHVRFLRHPEDAAKAIEALKSWMRREADVTFGSTNGHEWLASDPAKIAWAQWRILVPGASLYPDRMGFDAECFRLAGIDAYPGQPLDTLKQADWRAIMNALGERVRELRG